MVEKVLRRLVLACTAFYLVPGNLFRLYKTPFFQDNLLVTEFCLYLVSFIYFLLFLASWMRSPFFYFTLSCITCSAVLGIFVNQLHLPSLLYPIRLILMICTGLSIGHALYSSYQLDLRKSLDFFLKVYLANVAIGALIYGFFYSSAGLWLLLAKYGIVFNGDPHTGRFVSPYFDPNLFGAIACIPFLMSYSQWKWDGTGRGKMVLFAFIILLTWSRSAIMTLFLLLSWIFLTRVRRNYFLVRAKSIFLTLAVLILLVTTLAICSMEASYFTGRLIHMGADASALKRLESFLWGWDVLIDHFFLGIGYNFLSFKLGQVTSSSSIDSSLLSTFINFGCLLSLTFFGWLAIWLFNASKRLQMHRERPELSSFFHVLTAYLFICILFTCQFNNLLYYPFWFIPTLALFSYMAHCVKALHHAPEPIH